MRMPVRIWPLFLETSWISTVQEGYASPSIRFKADANVLMSVILFVPIVFSILSVIVCVSDSYGLIITHPTLFYICIGLKRWRIFTADAPAYPLIVL